MTDELFANRYRQLEPLGRGSMSAVWLAEDTELGRRVAVKTLGPTADRQRFTREARAVAALAHPNICALYDFGEADGRPFMVLEYLPNGSLEELLARGKPLRDEDAARIAADVAAGLAHAHARGLVHRDLKPANILFDGEGRAKIADFGIARMGGTGTLTEAGTVLGTASYISPEQAAGEPAGPPSDVYSFGVVLFRMLTGRLPFVGSNAMEVVRMHRDDPPPRVADARPGAPPALAALADSSLAKAPEARPADGAALAAALRGEADTARTLIAETEATRVLPPPPTGPRRRRTLVAIAVVAAALLAGGIVLAYALTRDNGGGKPPPPTTTALTIPTVPTEQTTTAPTTTAEPTTSEQTTTAPTTTTAETTTAPATTAVPTTIPTLPTTTLPLPTTTVLPTTTAPETTTADTTTIAVP